MALFEGAPLVGANRDSPLLSVRNCIYPWHWMLVTDGGEILPCGHGSKAVGNLRLQSAEEIWNGHTLREVRAAILSGEVHDVCRSSDCPYQQEHVTIPEAKEVAGIDEELVRTFDDEWYLKAHPDVAEAVEALQFASGFEHFARHGRGEGRAYQLVSQAHVPAASVANASLALVEYSRRATVLRSKPVDIVMQVSTICNLQCVMCSHGHEGIERPRHMPLEIVEHMQPFLDVAARMIVSGLGEPLLAPAFWHLVEKSVHRDDIFIRANSNAYFLTAGNALRVLNSGLKEMSFSLDAATVETYAKIRGGDFTRVLHGVATMCAMRRQHPRETLDVFINMTLMVENITEAPKFVELAHQLGVDAVLFSQLFPFGNEPGWRVRRDKWTFAYPEQMLTRVPEMARECLSAAKARAEELGMKIVFQSNTARYLETTRIEA